MAYENRTLGSLLSDPRIRPIAGDAIRNRDLREEPLRNFTLEQQKIPCRLEIGLTGGHGFADGTGMCMAGWTERAAK